MSYLSRAQVEQLLKPINPRRVSQRDGLAYVEAYDVKAHMIRIFGFARWSSEVVEQVLLFEQEVQTKNGKPAWSVAYRSVVKVTVNAPDGTVLAIYTEGHAGSSVHPDRGEAHGNAITNSESYAFKRSATLALADQGGLSLYGKGSTAALVGRTLNMPADGEDEDEDAGDVDAATPQVHPESPENPAPDEAPAEPAHVMDYASENADADAIDTFRDRVLAIPDDLAPRAAIVALTRLQMDAQKAHLLDHMTVGRDGEADAPVSLRRLIDSEIARRGAK